MTDQTPDRPAADAEELSPEECYAVYQRSVMPAATALRDLCNSIGCCALVHFEIPRTDRPTAGYESGTYLNLEAGTSPAMAGAVALVLGGVPGMDCWAMPPRVEKALAAKRSQMN